MVKGWIVVAFVSSALVWGACFNAAFGQAFQPPTAFVPPPAQGTVGPTGLGCSTKAPTISSGFGVGNSITSNNGTCSFEINVGTGGAASTGVIGLPLAATGWNCYATDITTTSAAVSQTKQTASSTTSCTIGNYTDLSVSGAWVASDKLRISASAY